MARRKKTGFDRYLGERMAEPKFAAEYEAARAEIDTIDLLVRALDGARMAENISKAELARRIGAKPEIIRRLFTSDAANPTVDTVLKIATALGYELQLVPAKHHTHRSKRRPDEAPTAVG